MMKIAVTNRTLCYRLHSAETDGTTSANSQHTSDSNLLQDPVIRCLLQQIQKISADGTYEKILLREKDLPVQDYLALAEAVFSVCRDTPADHPVCTDSSAGSPLILHNFPEAAERFRTDLHLPFSVFRELADSIRSDYPHIKKIGTSVHSTDDAVYAESHGADYVIAGHIFATDCKQGLPGRGTDWLRSVCDAVSIPVFAIGGISEQNLPALSDCPIAGACMMSEAMR